MTCLNVKYIMVVFRRREGRAVVPVQTVLLQSDHFLLVITEKKYYSTQQKSLCIFRVVSVVVFSFSHSIFAVLFSALVALSTISLFIMKVSLSIDIIPSGWLGSKHQLTN